MAKANCEYSELKSALLEVWCPIVGARSVADLWTNLLGQLRHDAWSILYETVVKHFNLSQRYIEQQTSFKTNIADYFDKEPPFEVSETFLSGSWSEGLFLFAEDSIIEIPDMDFMCVLKNISFSMDDQERGNLSLKEDTPFVHAFITSEDKLNMWNEYLVDERDGQNRQRLSSIKLKKKLEENCAYIGNLYSRCSGGETREKVTDGPAITISKPKPGKCYARCITDAFQLLDKPINEVLVSDIFDEVNMAIHDLFYKMTPSSDIVLCIFCEGWPSCAREWLRRKRHWPDAISVRKITQSGFHIVPKSSADGDFRLSFSCAEMMLVQTFSTLQHKVLRAFKAVVKYHQTTWSPDLKDILSSYHIKTIAFWHFEKSSKESWTEENMVHHLVSLLDELAEAVRNQNLPMYFMPKVNLLQKVDDPEVALDVAEGIVRISRNFCTISTALSNINLPRYLKAREKELKNIFRILNSKCAEKRSSNETNAITLAMIIKRIFK